MNVFEKHTESGSSEGKPLSPRSFEVFPKIIFKLKKGSKLLFQDLERLEDLFGERIQKALELVGERRVKKYIFRPSRIVRWVVTGFEKDYLVIEHSFCSCKDFLFSALLRRETPSCYHLLAREIAERTETFEEIQTEDGLYSTFMSEWLP